MNCYAYPIIFDAVKSEKCNNISIYLYDLSTIRIFKKDEFIILKDKDGIIYYNNDTFNFFINKPIRNILIISDKYGPKFSQIFDREYWRSAVAIQKAWKRYINN